MKGVSIERGESCELVESALVVTKRKLTQETLLPRIHINYLTTKDLVVKAIIKVQLWYAHNGMWCWSDCEGRFVRIVPKTHEIAELISQNPAPSPCSGRCIRRRVISIVVVVHKIPVVG